MNETTDPPVAPTEPEDPRWEGCGAEELAGLWRLPRVDLHPVVGSTNDVAKTLALAGAPHNTLVLADEQRAGRGRAGRAWSSPPGLGLWFSLVLRDVEPEMLATLPLRIALEVACALDSWSRSPILVKWPNDLLAGRAKLGGILCESTWEGARPRFVVAGIGLNLLQTESDFPPEIRSSATSLRRVAMRGVSRSEVAASVVGRLRRLKASYALVPATELPAHFAGRDALRGRRLEVVEPDTGRSLARGIGSGIDTDGTLLIDGGGSLAPLRSGTVRVLED